MSKVYVPRGLQSIGVTDEIPSTLTLDNLTKEQLAQIGNDRLKDLVSFNQWSSVFFNANKPFSASSVPVFTAKSGDTVKYANDSQTVVLSDADTNIRTDKVERGETLFIQSIQVWLAEYGLGGTPSAQDVQALFNNGVLVFHVGNKDYEEGLLSHFPSENLITGLTAVALTNSAPPQASSGGSGLGIPPPQQGGGSAVANPGGPGAGGSGAGGTTALSNSLVSAAFNNGAGRPKMLPVARTVDAGRSYRAQISFNPRYQPAANGRLVVGVSGYKLRSIQ